MLRSTSAFPVLWPQHHDRVQPVVARPANDMGRASCRTLVPQLQSWTGARMPLSHVPTETPSLRPASCGVFCIPRTPALPWTAVSACHPCTVSEVPLSARTNSQSGISTCMGRTVAYSRSSGASRDFDSCNQNIEKRPYRLIAFDFDNTLSTDILGEDHWNAPNSLQAISKCEFGGHERVCQLRQLFSILRQHTVKLFIVSFGHLQRLKDALFQASLFEFFAEEDIVSQDSLELQQHGFSKGAVIRARMAEHDIPPEAALFIDDCVKNLQSASGICTTYCPKNKSFGLTADEIQAIIDCYMPLVDRSRSVPMAIFERSPVGRLRSHGSPRDTIPGDILSNEQIFSAITQKMLMSKPSIGALGSTHDGGTDFAPSFIMADSAGSHSPKLPSRISQPRLSGGSGFLMYPPHEPVADCCTSPNKSELSSTRRPTSRSVPATPIMSPRTGHSAPATPLYSTRLVVAACGPPAVELSLSKFTRMHSQRAVFCEAKSAVGSVNRGASAGTTPCGPSCSDTPAHLENITDIFRDSFPPKASLFFNEDFRANANAETLTATSVRRTRSQPPSDDPSAENDRAITATGRCTITSLEANRTICEAAAAVGVDTLPQTFAELVGRPPVPECPPVARHSECEAHVAVPAFGAKPSSKERTKGEVQVIMRNRAGRVQNTMSGTAEPTTPKILAPRAKPSSADESRTPRLASPGPAKENHVEWFSPRAPFAKSLRQRSSCHTASPRTSSKGIRICSQANESIAVDFHKVPRSVKLREHSSLGAAERSCSSSSQPPAAPAPPVVLAEHLALTPPHHVRTIKSPKKRAGGVVVSEACLKAIPSVSCLAPPMPSQRLPMRQRAAPSQLGEAMPAANLEKAILSMSMGPSQSEVQAIINCYSAVMPTKLKRPMGSESPLASVVDLAPSSPPSPVSPTSAVAPLGYSAVEAALELASLNQDIGQLKQTLATVFDSEEAMAEHNSEPPDSCRALPFRRDDASIELGIGEASTTVSCASSATLLLSGPMGW